MLSDRLKVYAAKSAFGLAKFNDICQPWQPVIQRQDLQRQVASLHQREFACCITLQIDLSKQPELQKCDETE